MDGRPTRMPLRQRWCRRAARWLYSLSLREETVNSRRIRSPPCARRRLLLAQKTTSSAATAGKTQGPGTLLDIGFLPPTRPMPHLGRGPGTGGYEVGMALGDCRRPHRDTFRSATSPPMRVPVQQTPTLAATREEIL